MKVSRYDKIFFALFGSLALSAFLWLMLGLLPALASWTPLHDVLHRWAEGSSPLSQLARNAAHTAHSAERPPQVILDYLFSGFNLALGLILVKLRPRDRNARLLSVALVGTAVAFNLQGHDAFQVVPAWTLAKVDVWHVALHVISGVSYVFAVVMFPEGRLRQARPWLRALQIPVLGFLTLTVVMLSMISSDDHTIGLVVMFGVVIPLAGVGAQLFRYARPSSPQARQQSKVVLGAMVLAIAVAVPLAVATSGGDSRRRTVSYEFSAAKEGVYFFRCDPHPDEMIGILRVVAPGSSAAAGLMQDIEVEARDNNFDTSEIVIAAGRDTRIDLTNYDVEPHNIAFYTATDAREPMFIGEEFSASNNAIFAFRIFRLVFAVIPVALFAALLHFRLWDVDRVINRTLVYGVLAGLVTMIYLGIIVGAGTALGVSSRGNVVLSIVLTAILAVAFQPLRDRARRLVNRLVYGKRATPYEVLAEFSNRAGQAYAIDEVLPRMAQVLAAGIGAERVEIWLKLGNRLVRSATWPDHNPLPGSMPLASDEVPAFPGSDLTVPVRHRGELLGAIAVVKPSGEQNGLLEDRLINDVASQAGLVLRNAQLTAELQSRLDELEASRHRLVSAQDAERKRLERNLHDGAQQQLVALSMKLRMAQEVAAGSDEVRSLLEQLQADTTDALHSVRDLARGIHPPVLSDKGLAAALEAHARRCPIEVKIDARRIGRLPEHIENAVYFCCLEAIQNSIKHSGGVPVSVRLWIDGDRVHLSIEDRGRGFDPLQAPKGAGLQNMIDRMAALGGELHVESAVGEGTSVWGHAPIEVDTQPPSDGTPGGIRTPDLPVRSRTL